MKQKKQSVFLEKVMVAPLDVALASGESEVKSLRSEFRAGWSLPSYYYLSPEQYERDIAALRETTWFMAGHASQIPNKGDYRRITIANESVVIVRGKSGEINAFYNVCRHRGSHLCKEDEGRIDAFVCPYHAWTYKLDGELMRPRSMPSSFDPKQFGLKSCELRSIDGILFISLAVGTPPDFEEFASRLLPFMAPYQLTRAKAVAQERVISNTGWKLPVENFFECYHCPNAHKDLSRILTLVPPDVEPVDENGETWSGRMKRLGRTCDTFFDDPNSVHLQTGMQVEIGKGHVSATMDGRPNSRPLGDITEWSGGWTLINFNPFAHAIMHDDYVQLVSYIPIDQFTTEAVMIWLVHEDAVEGEDYSVETLTQLMSITMNEDKLLTDENQKGMFSTAYEPCPLSIEEQRMADFHQWYFNRIVGAA